MPKADVGNHGALLRAIECISRDAAGRVLKLLQSS